MNKIQITILMLVIAFISILDNKILAVELPENPIISASENTPALCVDGKDNDEDGAIDDQDVDCTTPTNASSSENLSRSASASENTPALCVDGKDNDEDGAIDDQDVDCNLPPTPAPTPTTSGPSFGGGSGPSFSSSLSGITSGTPVSAISTGTPVSATSSEPVCAEMLKTYMKKGKNNNTAEVKKLQGLLNKYLGLKIPTTGFFGNMTIDGVKAFQLKYKDSVLTPWGITAPTGYFYKTTQRQMNLLLCSTAEIPMPVLK